MRQKKQMRMQIAILFGMLKPIRRCVKWKKRSLQRLYR